MSIIKSNRYKEYILELEEIEDHLSKNEWATPPLQRKFYVHRKSLIKNLIEEYLNSSNERDTRN